MSPGRKSYTFIGKSISRPIHGKIPDYTTEARPKEAEKGHKGRSRLKWNGSWLWEIGAVLLSIICLALLVAFLAKIHGTPYASWQYTVSPNTIVSVIITIAKASFLVAVSACLSQLKWNQYRGATSKPLYSMQAVDQASRGPWGSLDILFNIFTGIRMDVLTLTGASITVLALAVDPFAQQILAFPERTVLASNETALVRSTHGYNFTGHLTRWSGSISDTMVSSLLVGLAQHTDPLASQCPTSTCTFPGFISLGFCSHCEDVTKDTKQVCGPWSMSDPTAYSLHVHGYCNYTTPNGVHFMGEVNADAVPPTEEDVYLTYDYVYTDLLNNGTSYDSPLLYFVAASERRVVHWTRQNRTAPAPKPSISICRMYVCEQQFSPSRYIATDSSTHYSKISHTQELITSYNEKAIKLTPANGAEFLSKDPYDLDADTLSDLEFTLQGVFNLSGNTQNGLNSMNFVPIMQKRGINETMASIAASLTNNIRSTNNPLGENLQERLSKVKASLMFAGPG
ncbi:hypothetical protein N7470_002904 [Penicillium chermesinum]|nr:hypothetical protein N7470_002904 [Penicillium chermesinum]